jgi:predicted ATPase
MPENETPKLRIKKLTVENFRGIDHLELDFVDHNDKALDLVVFAGSNGVGKTSVLEAILLLLNFQGGYWLVGSNYQDYQIRFGTKKTVLKCEMEARLGLKVANFSTELGKDNFAEARTSLMRPRFNFLVRSEHDSLSNVVSRGEAQAEYFSSRRHTEDQGNPQNQNPPQIIPPGITRISELKRQVISTYYRMLRNGGKKSNGPFDKLQKVWRLFHGNDQELDVIPVDNNPGSGDEVVIRDPKPIPSDITSLAQARELAPTRDDIPSMVPLDRLSAGQLALLSFAGPLVFRDKPVDFVLIDEPEQHLHVQWQRFLIPALQELAPQAQFFVATHSEEILNSVLSYERFILVTDEDPRSKASDAELGA